MEVYAVMETGGKQYRVKQGDILDVERLAGGEGADVQFNTLAISKGSELFVGAPILEGGCVRASVVAVLRGKKIYSFKKKRRKGYRRKIGHRQELTRIKVEEISA